MGATKLPHRADILIEKFNRLSIWQRQKSVTAFVRVSIALKENSIVKKKRSGYVI